MGTYRVVAPCAWLNDDGSATVHRSPGGIVQIRDSVAAELGDAVTRVNAEVSARLDKIAGAAESKPKQRPREPKTKPEPKPVEPQAPEAAPGTVEPVAPDVSPEVEPVSGQ